MDSLLGESRGIVDSGVSGKTFSGEALSGAFETKKSFPETGCSLDCVDDEVLLEPELEEVTVLDTLGIWMWETCMTGGISRVVRNSLAKGRPLIEGA